MSENGTQQQQLKSLITVFLGTNLIFWVLSIFIIIQVYKINETLKGIKDQLTYQATANQSLSNFEVVDKDGTVVYSFQQVPMPDMEYGDEMDPSMAPGSTAPGTEPAPAVAPAPEAE